MAIKGLFVGSREWADVAPEGLDLIVTRLEAADIMNLFLVSSQQIHEHEGFGAELTLEILLVLVNCLDMDIND